MKKSEAKKKILSLIKKASTYDSAAEKIIKWLDDNGMSPLKYISSGCLHSMRESCNCQGTYSNEWDKEDKK